MWTKLCRHDLKQSLCSRVSIGLILLFFCMTISGLMNGHIKYQEMMMVARGSDKVVNISNTGSFFHKMENILERSFRFDYGSTNPQAQYRFLFAKLTELWPVMGLALVLMYGYFYLMRERAGEVTEALVTGPVNIRDYYWGKAASGALYMGIFCGMYGLLLYLFSVWLGGASNALLMALSAGILLFWGYCVGLWALYLFIHLGGLHPERATAFFLVVVLVIGAVIPAGVQLVGRFAAGRAPEVPYLLHSPGVLAFVSGKDRSDEDLQAIELDLQELTQYRHEVTRYLRRGMAAETRLAYLSPILLFQRLEKVFFFPELADSSRYLEGMRECPSIPHLIHQKAGEAVFLGILLVIAVSIPPIFISNRERDSKRRENISQKNVKCP